MKSKLSATARMDVLLNVFFTLFLNSFATSFREIFVIRRQYGNISIYAFGVPSRTSFAGRGSGWRADPSRVLDLLKLAATADALVYAQTQDSERLTIAIFLKNIPNLKLYAQHVWTGLFGPRVARSGAGIGATISNSRSSCRRRAA
jgi:hypothetical protein